MELNKKEQKIVQQQIERWLNDSIIDANQASKMNESINKKVNSYKTLTTFAFIIAGCSALLAVFSILFEAKFIVWLQRQFDFAEITIGIIFLTISLLIFIISKRYHHKFTAFSKESLNVAGAITTAIGITYIGRSQSINEVYYPLLIGITAICYFIAAYVLHSKILWAVALITATGWFTTQVYVSTHYKFSLLGLNFALLGTIWGILIWVTTNLYNGPLVQFKHTQNLIGIILTLFAAWTLSIFGNYDEYSSWELISQGKLWYWALAYSIALIGLTIYGVKYDKDYIRDIAMSFFILNIYTRYFEYFWDKTQKGIFFALLAVSFYFVGKQFDRIRRKTSE